MPGAVTYDSPRLGLVAERDPASAELVARLLRLAAGALSRARAGKELAFTLEGARRPGGGWSLRPAGLSTRYSAIAALGLARLPEREQRRVLGGMTAGGLLEGALQRVVESGGRGDVALVCWAAAETGHPHLPRALSRLAELERRPGAVTVMDAAWVITALTAALPHADVESHLAAARDRLLAARAVLFPHEVGTGGSWYRRHVGSFADQVYPIQALARLSAAVGDPAALAAAESVAAAICRAQGDAGQWWWHYDSRTGDVIEEYPVYSVHQHAMAPMALLDLADAGGECHLAAICRGLRWLARPPETSEDLILDDPGITWRKVGRDDPRKLVRGLRAAVSGVAPGSRLPALSRVFAPGRVDHECRPYEPGWLLMTWLQERAAER